MTPAEIKQARQLLGLNQQQMAQVLGYNAKSRISEIETGKRNPGDAVTRLIEAYLRGYRPADWPGGIS